MGTGFTVATVVPKLPLARGLALVIAKLTDDDDEEEEAPVGDKGGLTVMATEPEFPDKGGMRRMESRPDEARRERGGMKVASRELGGLASMSGGESVPMVWTGVVLKLVP